jgi:hypothetical protein
MHIQTFLSLIEEGGGRMPGKRGVDTYEEREFLEYQPEIERDVPPIVSEEHAGRLEEQDIALSNEDAGFIEDIQIADQKLDDFEQLLDDQQALMEIPVPDERSDTRESLEYMINYIATRGGLGELVGIARARTDNVITFDIYKRAYTWWKDGAQRAFGGDVLASDGSVEQAQALSSQIQKYDNDRVLQLVAYTVISYVLDFAGKKVIPNFYPFKPLKKQFIKWAKSLIKKKAHAQPPEPSVGDRDTEERFTTEDGPWKSTFDSKPPRTSKETPPIEALGHAVGILDFVHFNASQGTTPGANPTSFYMRPMYDYARGTHMATKVAAQLGAAGAVEFKLAGENIQLFTPSDLFKYKGYVGGRTSEYNELLWEDSSATHKLKESGLWTSLRDMGYDNFIRTLDTSMGVLRWWFQSPDTICCVVRALSGIGKIDKSFMYALRTVLLHMIEKERDTSQYVFDDMTQLLNTLVLALTGKIAGVLESISQRAIRGLGTAIKSIREDSVARNCTPLDELLATLQGGILGLQIDLTTMVNSIIGDLTLRDAKLVTTTANLEKKQRLERFLKIVDVIINALETGELCSEEVDETNRDVPPIPTIDEIERFLTVGLLPEFEDSHRSRKYIMEKFKRDPVTGQSIDRLVTVDTVSRSVELIRQTLDDCGKRVDAEALKRITDTMKERGVI